MTGDSSPHVEEKSSFLAWDFLYSDQSSQAFLYLFIASALFASSANGFLFFLTLKKQLWQPHYVLLKHASACDVGKTLGTVLAVFSSGSWHFSTLLCFSLTSQMTLTLMVVERYLLTCHGTDYLRMVTTRRVHITAGLVWLLSGATSIAGGLLLHRMLLAAQQTTAELQGDALTIRENITCSREDVMPVLVPPCVFMTLCTLAMCYCCGRMYHASLRASVAVKRLNRRAHRSAAFCLLMFLLQLAPHLITFTTASLCPPITSLVTAQLMTIPSCINAAFQLLRNPQIKPLVRSALHLEGRCAVCPDVTEPDVTEPDGTEAHGTETDGTEERTMERENTATTPPPPLGSVSASVCY